MGRPEHQTQVYRPSAILLLGERFRRYSRRIEHRQRERRPEDRIQVAEDRSNRQRLRSREHDVRRDSACRVDGHERTVLAVVAWGAGTQAGVLERARIVLASATGRPAVAPVEHAVVLGWFGSAVLVVCQPAFRQLVPVPAIGGIAERHVLTHSLKHIFRKN